MLAIYIIGFFVTFNGILILQKKTAGEDIHQINIKTVLFISAIWFAFMPFFVMYITIDLVGRFINLFIKREDK